jgi:hypothetical protein
MLRFAMLSLLLAGLIGSAGAERLSYDYAYLSHQDDRVNGQNFTNDTFGVYYEFGRHWHVFGSYGNAGSYGNPAWKDSRAARIGLGGHWLLGDDTMIAVEAVGVHAQFDKPGVGTIRDTGESGIVEVRHRFGRGSKQSPVQATRMCSASGPTNSSPVRSITSIARLLSALFIDAPRTARALRLPHALTTEWPQAIDDRDLCCNSLRRIV